MRSILFGILALLALIVVSALSALILVAPNSVGPDLQLIPLGAHAQGGGKSRGYGPQALVGHRQPTVQDVQNVQESHSADEAMRKIDEGLKKKLQGICRGC
jgi:hypothetical protein